MQRNKIVRAVDKLIEVHYNESTQGANPSILKGKYRDCFINAILLFYDNGSQIYKYMLSKGISTSYKAINNYLRLLFGAYTHKSRPSPYFRLDFRIGGIVKDHTELL